MEKGSRVAAAPLIGLNHRLHVLLDWNTPSVRDQLNRPEALGMGPLGETP